MLAAFSFLMESHVGTASKFWTDDNMTALRKLVAEGLSADQIADRMGTTRNVVIGKVSRTPGLHLARSRKAAAKAKQRTGWQAIYSERKSASKPLPPSPIVDVRAEVKPSPFFVADILRLESNNCRWPVDRGYCGAPICREHESYCSHHARRSVRRVLIAVEGTAERQAERGE